MTQDIQTQKQYIDAQYELFRHEYEMRYPPPKTDTQSQRRSMLIILVASILVSAYHTIPFFIGEAPSDPIGLAIRIGLALCIVGMLEWGLVKVGEFLIEYLDTDTIQTLRPVLLFIALTLLLFVAIFANILDVMDNRNMYIVGWLTTLVTVIAGLTAPVMALITGVIFASLELKVSEDMSEWQRRFNAEWSKFKRQEKIDVTVSAPVSSPTLLTDSVSMSMSNQTDNRQTGAGYRRSSTAVDNAKAWLNDNPDKAHLSVRALSELIPGAGKDSIAKARRELQAEGRLNGHVK